LPRPISPTPPVKLFQPSLINSRNKISIFYQNTRGLRTKTTEVFNSVAQSEFKIFAFTETWLDASVGSSELFSSNFNVFRSDRNFAVSDTTRGGGVLIAAHQEYACTQIDLQELSLNNFKYIDILILKIKLHATYLYLINLYIPPKTPNAEFENLFETLELADFLHNHKVLILGDFNITEYASSLSSSQVTTKLFILNNFVGLLDLAQNNFIFNDYDKLLDLVYSNFSCNVLRSLDPVVAEDKHHPSLEIECELTNKSNNSNLGSSYVDCYNFRRANIPVLYDMISNIDWTFLDSFSDAEDACVYFYGKLYNVLDRCVPRYTINNSRKYPPWFNANIIKLIRKKSFFRARYKKQNDAHDLNEFKRIRTEIKTAIENSYKHYIEIVESEISINSNKFWAFVDNKKSTGKVANNMTYNDEVLDNPSDILKSFAEYFSQSYTHPKAANVTVKELQSSYLNINSFTENQVLDALKAIKPKPTTGPDHIPAFVVRDCAYTLVRPLTILINICIKSNTIPSMWKSSKVCPIFKKGDRTNIKNYRPISVICNFCKALEILLERSIYQHVSRSIISQQHGFMKGRSTVTNLSIITQHIAENIDDRIQTDVIYTDMTKAFDRLDHNILLIKLASFGLSPSLIELFKSYFHNRSQYVQLNGFKSGNYFATSGIPQGSNLGPLLFNIFINDISDVIDVNYLLYADDLKIYTTIQTITDCERLQANLNQVTVWCKTNNLELNPAKCSVMSYSLKSNQISYRYTIDVDILNRPKNFTDLGVVFDSALSFNDHIDTIAKSANRTYGFIVRIGRDFKSPETLKSLYYSFVRSKLEYASIVWYPFYQVHIVRLEAIQRRFLKFLSFRSDQVYPPIGFPHETLLMRHGFSDLSRRREYFAVIVLHKIVSNKTDCIDLLHMLDFKVPRQSSRYINLFHLRTPRTNVLMNSPLHNMCNAHNRIAHQIDIFHNSLKNIKSIFFH
jgi:Reverse transcriptase (RNA-dependent DNA polymerase)